MKNLMLRIVIAAIVIGSLTGCKNTPNTVYFGQDGKLLLAMDFLVNGDSLSVKYTVYRSDNSIISGVENDNNCSILNNDNWECDDIKMINGEYFKKGVTSPSSTVSMPEFYFEALSRYGIINMAKLYLKAG